MQNQKNFHHGNLKQALLEAALKLLDEHGAAGVTIRAVAKETGVSHAAPVNHYKDRRALLTALATELFGEILNATLRRLNDDALTDKERILSFAVALCDYGLAHPNRYQLIWRSDLVDHQDAGLLAVMDELYDALCAELVALPGKAGCDTDTMAVSLWSMAHGYIDMRLTGMFEPHNDSVTHEPRFTAMLELYFRALQ